MNSCTASTKICTLDNGETSWQNYEKNITNSSMHKINVPNYDSNVCRKGNLGDNSNVSILFYILHYWPLN